MPIIAKVPAPKLGACRASWRAIEAIAHKWANANPGAVTSFWLCNHFSGFSSGKEIRATASGKLSEDSLANLRYAKRMVDRGEDYDCLRAYCIGTRHESQCSFDRNTREVTHNA